MSARFSTTFALSISLMFPGVVAGCSSDPEGAEAPPGEAPTLNTEPAPAPEPTTPATAPPPAPKPVDDPGPAPTGCPAPTKDQNGFFKRTTAKSDYVAFVPKSYAGKPTTLVVGIHGCGDSAQNFATWAIAPWKTRATQSHIGISIGGKDGQCWDPNTDVEKVTAAIEDISKCYYVHQQKVVLAGYSSGGIMAYRMGLSSSDKYAGILIENSALGGASPSSAKWKINIAHTANTGDTTFPISKVKQDWAKIEAAGLPLLKREGNGTHEGSGDDWSDWLLPKIAAWKAP
jgi:predicted esterase